MQRVRAGVCTCARNVSKVRDLRCAYVYASTLFALTETTTLSDGKRYAGIQDFPTFLLTQEGRYAFSQVILGVKSILPLYSPFYTPVE